MTAWHLFATVAMIGGDIFALFSLIGSAFMLLDALTINSSLRRLFQFFTWSIMGLIIGAIGQIAIVITHTQLDETFIFRFSQVTVNGILILSFLMLMGQWMIRRSRRYGVQR